MENYGACIPIHLIGSKTQVLNADLRIIMKYNQMGMSLVGKRKEHFVCLFLSFTLTRAFEVDCEEGNKFGKTLFEVF